MTDRKIDLNLPWQTDEGSTAIYDADGSPAAYALSADETPLIVKAVNNHEALVAMVKRLSKCLKDDGASRAAGLDARDLLGSLD